MTDEIPLFPISGWSIGPIKAYEAVTVKFNYLTSPLQPVEEALASPQFVMLAPQARELIEGLQKALHQLETSEFQAAPGPRH